MSPIRVKKVKGGFWDRVDDIFDVPGFLVLISWAVWFAFGIFVGVALF